jgi:hypothetical protein
VDLAKVPEATFTLVADRSDMPVHCLMIALLIIIIIIICVLS